MTAEVASQRGGTPRCGTGESALRFAVYGALLALTALLVSPQGDFPLNDDWIYAKEVRALLEQGRYVQHPFSAPLGAAQVVWGAMFAKVFGFSFTTLRLSTLALAWVAAWATAQCAREAGASRAAALLAGIVLLANPVFLNLAYSFNTDVPLLAPLALSIWFFLRAVRTASPYDAGLGALFSAIAFLIRQFGVAPTVAFMAVGVWAHRRATPVVSRAGVVAMIIPWFGAGTAALWIRAANPVHYVWHWHLQVLPLDRLLERTGCLTAIVAISLGLFVLPAATVWLGPILRRPRAWRPESWAMAGAFAAALALALRHVEIPRRLPLLVDHLRDLGTGPVTFTPVGETSIDWQVVHLGGWWWIPTVLAIGAIAALIVQMAVLGLGRDSPDPKSHTTLQGVFLIACTMFLLGALANPLLPCIFDRYLLAPLVPLAVFTAGLIGPRTSRWSWALGAGVSGVFYLFAVLGVQDYLAWNAARWDAIHHLLDADRVDPFQIDAGFEYQGMYTSDEYMRRRHTTDFEDHGAGPGWWILDDAYAVTFWPRRGYAIIRQTPYYSYFGRKEPAPRRSPWLRMDEHYILTLKRMGPADSASPGPTRKDVTRALISAP